MLEGDNMPKLTKSQAKKRLNEAKKKVQTVYMLGIGINPNPVQTQDLVAIEKIINKCLNRIK